MALSSYCINDYIITSHLLCVNVVSKVGFCESRATCVLACILIMVYKTLCMDKYRGMLLKDPQSMILTFKAKKKWYYFPELICLNLYT